MGEQVDSVVVDAEYDNYSASGPATQFEDVEFLVVNLASGDTHIWFNGKHYEAAGIANSLSEGDMFYNSTPEKQIFRLAETEETDHDSLVDIEYLYPDNMMGSINRKVLIDDYERAMGDPGPPALLEEKPLE